MQQVKRWHRSLPEAGRPVVPWSGWLLVVGFVLLSRWPGWLPLASQTWPPASAPPGGGHLAQVK